MKALKKGYKRASIQLPPILSHFSAKLDQSQSAFFFGTEEVYFSVSGYYLKYKLNSQRSMVVCTIQLNPTDNNVRKESNKVKECVWILVHGFYLSSWQYKCYTNIRFWNEIIVSKLTVSCLGTYKNIPVFGNHNFTNIK